MEQPSLASVDSGRRHGAAGAAFVHSRASRADARVRPIFPNHLTSIADVHLTHATSPAVKPFPIQLNPTRYGLATQAVHRRFPLYHVFILSRHQGGRFSFPRQFDARPAPGQPSQKRKRSVEGVLEAMCPYGPTTMPTTNILPGHLLARCVSPSYMNV